MSLTPWMMRDVFRPSNSPMSLLDQNFGLGLLNDDLMLLPAGIPSMSTYLRPWRHLPGRQSGTSSLCLDKDGFKVNLDVQQFLPEEVNVKVVDNFVVVEGHHEERLDEHGFIERNFKRRYAIPKEVEAEAITSTLSSDGVLTIAAPAKKPIALADQNERVVPIVHTQVPAVKSATAAGFANGKAVEKKEAKK